MVNKKLEYITEVFSDISMTKRLIGKITDTDAALDDSACGSVVFGVRVVESSLSFLKERKLLYFLTFESHM